MNITKIYTIIACFLVTSLMHAQQAPAPKQQKAIAIVGATAHIGNGNVIENSVIIFENGKIQTVADGSTIRIDRTKNEIIDAQGKHVYPGFIAPNSTLGLVEIDAVRATIDSDEVGQMNPNIRSIIAYNAESKIVESMRPNGVLMGQITPQGGRISGTSSIVQFDAWNWEDATVKADDAIHINWPNPYSRGRWWMGEPNVLKPNENYNNQVTELSDFFGASKAYLAGDKQQKNILYDGMSGIFNGKQKLFVHVSDEKGIRDAVEFTKKHQVKMVIVGGYDAYKVGVLLKQSNIPVILNGVHSRPNSDDDDYDLPYKAAKLLVDQGVLVGLQSESRNERINTRNIPFYAGTSVAYELDKEEALKLITSNTAKILGIDDFCGTLEVGKDATLFISEGDALDMRTNILTKAFVQGRDISLETHQTELAKRYSDKYKNE